MASSIPLHIFRSWAFCIQFIPAVSTRSSVQNVGGLPLGHIASHDRHIIILFAERSSSLLARWPAHLHFSEASLVRISVTLVLRLISSFRIQSRRDISRIFLSIALCITVSFSAVWRLMLFVSRRVARRCLIISIINTIVEIFIQALMPKSHIAKYVYRNKRFILNRVKFKPFL